MQPPRSGAWCEWLHAAAALRRWLWDVPYFPIVPRAVQFGVLGLPALLQVLTRTTFNPLALGVNQIVIARKRGHRR